MRVPLLCLVLVAAANQSIGARILAILPVPARSHHNMFHAVLTALAERGHQVVNYSPFPLANPVPNYTDIYLDNILTVDKTMTKGHLTALMNESPVGAAVRVLEPLATKIANDLMDSKKVNDLLHSNESFDLLILEAFFCQEFLLGFGHKFKIPVINLHPFGSFSFINKVSGNSLSLANIPDFTFYSSHHMSFYERLLSSYSILSSLFLYYKRLLPVQEENLRKFFKDPTMPHVEEMLQNISLFLNNAHPTVHYPQPYIHNIIPIGGIHLARNKNPLPSAMRKFLDESSAGVIYFSLGSLVPDHELPQHYFDNFLNVFRRLPQKVLWKTSSQIAGLPDNVMTASWVPQQDVLGHSNVVLFITHGGLFSQHEAIYHGVPVVCIPFFGDQPLNAKFYEHNEVGVKLLFNDLSEESIFSSVTTVLNDKKYRNNMQRLSRVYRDRPVSPTDSLIFWVEYVLRHRGAPHMRPASVQLSWYQLALLDALAAVFTALAGVLIVLFLLLKKVIVVFRVQSCRESSRSKKTK